MISRRNIRVKVMQTLYTVESSENTITPAQATRILEKHIDQSRQLFITLVYFLTEVARYAETDARQRASKHLPTAQDLNVNTRLAGNIVLWAMRENESCKKAIAALKPETLIDTDWIRKIYLQLVDTPRYKTYINMKERDKKEEKDILDFIFTDLMLPNEDFISMIEENFIHWDDDADMMNLLMPNFTAKPKTYNCEDFISDEKWQFARKLNETVIEKSDYCMELIKPKLLNWDPERTAMLDMILMKMGICELLYFETIPTKVTINEYIDLAKDYSTAQSGQFVNGILDNIHKELTAQNKIHKVSHKAK
ncbi:MAG: transcription antitermination factor NusB [Sphingobacteriales bacterium]|nr:transcription antitermination factor NusB [Sphingobacteriales bacterium]MBI3718949.1 transcription antitermination factor NusB [Sphingobacteriales bacterium]